MLVMLVLGLLRFVMMLVWIGLCVYEYDWDSCCVVRMVGMVKLLLLIIATL